MRHATAAELEVLASDHYVTHTRVLITDADGVERDLTALAGHNWFVAAEWGEDVDQPIMQPRIQVRREIGDLSLSPLHEGSPLNYRANQSWAPLADAGRRIRILIATLYPGAVPTADDWREIFDGEIDDWEIEHSPMVLITRDPGGVLHDTQIEDPKDYSSEAGKLLHVIMQELLDDTLGPGVVTLHVPTPPAQMITRYQPDPGSLLEALQTCAQSIGWDVRYRWHQASQSFRLTLTEPKRESTAYVHTFGPKQYIDITELRASRTEVRNVVQVVYQDRTTKKEERVTIQDDASIGRFRRRFMRITEGEGSPIDTAAEAHALAEFALSDTKDPKASHAVEMRYWPLAELGDIYRFLANGVHYTTDQVYAVVGIRHHLSEDRQRTTLVCRGKPSGGYGTWLKRAKRTPDTSAELYAQCLVSLVETYPDRLVFEVAANPDHGEVYLYELTGAALEAGSPALGVPMPSGTRWTILRPAPEAAQGMATWRAEAPGYVGDDQPMAISQVGQDTVALVVRATILESSDTEVKVRAAVADPRPAGGTGPVAVLFEEQGTGGVVYDTPGSIDAAKLRADIDDAEAAGAYVDFTITRGIEGAPPGRVVFKAGRVGRVRGLDSIDVSAPGEPPVLYAECQARVTASSATEITVTVDAVPPTAQVELLAGSTATRISGPLPGAKSPTGTVWKFQRPAALTSPTEARFRATLAGYESDDDHVLIPEQGRDTIGLLMRARVLSATATQTTVRVAVADPIDPTRTGAITVTPAQGGAIGALSPGTAQTIPAASVTSNIETTGYIDFVIGRGAAGSGGGRVIFTATRAGRVADSDAVDVPELPPTVPTQSYSPRIILTRLRIRAEEIDYLIMATNWSGSTSGLKWRHAYHRADTAHPGWPGFVALPSSGVEVTIPRHDSISMELLTQVEDDQGRVANAGDTLPPWDVATREGTKVIAEAEGDRGRNEAISTTEGRGLYDDGYDGYVYRGSERIPTSVLEDQASAQDRADWAEAGAINEAHDRGLTTAGFVGTLGGVGGLDAATAAQQIREPSQNLFPTHAGREREFAGVVLQMYYLPDLEIDLQALGLLAAGRLSFSARARISGANGNVQIGLLWIGAGGVWLDYTMSAEYFTTTAPITISVPNAQIPAGALRAQPVVRRMSSAGGTAPVYVESWMLNRGAVSLTFDHPGWRPGRPGEEALPAGTRIFDTVSIPREVARGIRQGEAFHDGSITLSPPYQDTPAFIPSPGGITFHPGLSAYAHGPVVRFLQPSPTGARLYAQLRATAGLPVTKSATFSSAGAAPPVGLVATKSEAAQAYDLRYTYIVSTSPIFPGNTLTVGYWYNTGTGWMLAGVRSFNEQAADDKYQVGLDSMVSGTRFGLSIEGGTGTLSGKVEWGEATVPDQKDGTTPDLPIPYTVIGGT